MTNAARFLFISAKRDKTTEALKKKGFLKMNDYPIIIPAVVRYDKSLPPLAKLLYGEIVILCTKNGFCWASNGFFAKSYGVDKRTISRHISTLLKRGYCFTDDNSEEAENTQRKIFLTPVNKNVNTLDKNVNTPRQNCIDPLNNFVYQNKINIIKKDNISRAGAHTRTRGANNNSDVGSYDLDLYEEMLNAKP